MERGITTEPSDDLIDLVEDVSIEEVSVKEVSKEEKARTEISAEDNPNHLRVLKFFTNPEMLQRSVSDSTIKRNKADDTKRPVKETETLTFWLKDMVCPYSVLKGSLLSDWMLITIIIAMGIISSLVMLWHLGRVVGKIENGSNLSLLELVSQVERSVYACIGEEVFQAKNTEKTQDDGHWLCQDSEGKYKSILQKYMGNKKIKDFFLSTQSLYHKEDRPNFPLLFPGNLGKMNIELMVKQLEFLKLLPTVILDSNIADISVVNITTVNFQAKLNQIQEDIFKFSFLNRQFLNKVTEPERCAFNANTLDNEIFVDDFVPGKLTEVLKTAERLKTMLDKSIADLKSVNKFSICSVNGSTPKPLSTSIIKGSFKEWCTYIKFIFSSDYYSFKYKPVFEMVTPHAVSTLTTAMCFVVGSYLFFGNDKSFFIQFVIVQAAFYTAIC